MQVQLETLKRLARSEGFCLSGVRSALFRLAWKDRQAGENGPLLYDGIRSDVARAVGCGESATFHAMFDLAVEQVF